MKLTLPTALTLLRIVLIPVLVVVFYLPYDWTNFAAAVVFAFASATDWLDGWIARRWNQYSASSVKISRRIEGSFDSQARM